MGQDLGDIDQARANALLTLYRTIGECASSMEADRSNELAQLIECFVKLDQLHLGIVEGRKGSRLAIKAAKLGLAATAPLGILFFVYWLFWR